MKQLYTFVYFPGKSNEFENKCLQFNLFKTVAAFSNDEFKGWEEGGDEAAVFSWKKNSSQI